MVHPQRGDEIVRPLALAVIRHPMDIPQGRVNILMAEQPLEPVHRQPRLELVGRIGVAQAMNTADLRHLARTLAWVKAFCTLVMLSASANVRPGNNHSVGRYDRQ